MKALKYFFYLLLLFGIGASILIATDEGEYTLEREKSLDVPVDMLYSELREWKSWANWHERWSDENTKITFDQKNLNWTSTNEFSKEGSGNIEELKPNQEIVFSSEIESSKGKSQHLTKISLEELDTYETNIKWETQIKLSFVQKIYAKLNKAKPFIETETDLFFSSLNQLERNIIEDMSQYHIEVMGIHETRDKKLVFSSASSTKTKFVNTALHNIEKLQDYAIKNQIPIDDIPEIIIHKGLWENTNNILFSVAFGLPKNYELESTNPEIVMEDREKRHTVKTSLKGNYSNWQKAYDKGAHEAEANDALQEEGEVIIWRLVNYKEQIANPAEWYSEFFIPIESPEPIEIRIE